MPPSDALDPSLFIGSSLEALEVAKHLQAELDYVCEPTVWTQGVFGPSATTIASLLTVVAASDFATLVVTADDSVVSRGQERLAARDNVIFELGLFIGALGPDRVFIVTPRGQDLKLPSDLAGVTTLNYRADRQDGNLRAALGPCAMEIQTRVSQLGLRQDRVNPDAVPSGSTRRGLTPAEELVELERELDAIARAAEAQGWTVKTRSTSAFRLIAKNNQRYSFAIGAPAETRDRLRDFANQLKKSGLRVSAPVLKPVNA